MKARRLPRGVYRRGEVLWIRFKNADGKLSRESTGQRDVKVAEAILAKRRAATAMLSHFPTRKFELLTFDDLREAWEPAHLKKTPSFRYLLPRVLAAFGGAKAREMTTERVQELPRVAVEALKSLPSYGLDDYVFPSKSSARWPSPKQPYRWDIGKEFRALVRSLGMADVRLHDLRHTGPSVLLMQGIPGDVVRKITGHRSRELEPLPAPLAGVQGPDGGLDRPGFV